ncbi:hypothetical protein AXY1_63 [Achromobacter phage AXY1]|nr:hypothetical protein AXY1_63 [Achromobacter phage AXY1]
MPQFKVLKTIERVNPKTKQFEQISVGTVLDELSDQDYRTYRRAGAVEIIKEQATQAPDVSAVLDAATTGAPAATPAVATPARGPKAGNKDSEVS